MFDKRKETLFFPCNLAVIHAGLGDRSAALSLLEGAYRIHDPAFMIRIALDPRFDPLRSDPAFKSILQRIGL